jgi:hypothetical protein
MTGERSPIVRQKRFNTMKIYISAILLLLSGYGTPIAVGQSSTIAATTTESRCEPYPKERAEMLITDPDTGQRMIKGDIIATAAVKSKDTFTGGKGQKVPIYVIAINVDGQVVTVLLGSDSSTGTGLYSSTDVRSEKATSFSQNRRIGSRSTEGVAQARACVTNNWKAIK